MANTQNLARETENEQATGTPITDTPIKEAEAKKKSVGREILEWIFVVVFAVGVALIIRTFIFEPVRVDGESMLRTLYNNEYMIVTKYQYLFNDPDRFDVVICHYPERGNTNFVKRIVGVPGDTIEVKDATLFVNGEPVDEPHIVNKPSYTMSAITVGEGHYFVLGDNRPNSNDSHNPNVGQLERKQIIGKVRLVVWPFNDFRIVK